jgi:hypothetical protein
MANEHNRPVIIQDPTKGYYSRLLCTVPCTSTASSTEERQGGACRVQTEEVQIATPGVTDVRYLVMNDTSIRDRNKRVACVDGGSHPRTDHGPWHQLNFLATGSIIQPYRPARFLTYII